MGDSNDIFNAMIILVDDYSWTVPANVRNKRLFPLPFTLYRA